MHTPHCTLQELGSAGAVSVGAPLHPGEGKEEGQGETLNAAMSALSIAGQSDSPPVSALHTHCYWPAKCWLSSALVCTACCVACLHTHTVYAYCVVRAGSLACVLHDLLQTVLVRLS